MSLKELNQLITRRELYKNNKMVSYTYLMNREMGNKQRIGDQDRLYSSIYNSINPVRFWKQQEDNTQGPQLGGVYSLEFSPDGNLLVAACERNAIAIFDTLVQRREIFIERAHTSCVNCIKFLDRYTFASCSDDTTVALWDTRNLGQRLHCLRGHANWVKNIEYSKHNKILVTSGFDGTICTWDLNSFVDGAITHQKVFNMAGLMRCAMSSDASKLVISTSNGLLIVIHDLNLQTLAEDLNGFRPNMHRLMSLGRQYVPYALKYEYLFSRQMKNNRVELIQDFPKDNDAEVISSLQIHPKGWCAISRNLNYDESSEWTCIHDIQGGDNCEVNIPLDHEDVVERDNSNQDSYFDEDDETASSDSDFLFNSSQDIQSNHVNTERQSENSQLEAEYRVVNMMDPYQNLPRNSNPDLLSADRLISDRIRDNSISSSEMSSLYSGLQNNTNDNDNLAQVNQNSVPISVQDIKYQTPVDPKRLLYYIKETTSGQGYIKESSFSFDGRLIASPYDDGIRILSFSENCSELPEAINFMGGTQQSLHVLKKISRHHNDVVTCTKFHPRDIYLVSGCLLGDVIWYQPRC